MTPAISMTGLARRYGRQFVLRDVHLEIAAGKVVVLTGSNGAGKTTLLRVLATRLRPSRGTGSVFGHDLVRAAPAVRAHVAYVGVLGGSYPALTARENLRLASSLYDRDRQLDDLLDRVGLAHAADKLVREFSSGMKKRLAIARLLLIDAPLWLLDEPYAALDEAGKHLVDELLVSARADGRTVVLASHEVDRCGRFADAVIEVANGGIRALEAVGKPRGAR
jgi:heme exporter protein A